ncbi:MAG TPA: hypothetical protein VGV86_14995 [Acidimicrobiales bacterium]|nr:hypothetical protein [Acidimicrobiales bacterium]
MTSDTARVRRLSPLGPGGRPFRGWRVVPMLLSVAALAVNAAILLSDRAPGLLRRLSARIDAGVSRAAGATGVDVPGTRVRAARSDFDVHVLIWGVAALLVGLAMWSWFSLAVGNGTLFGSSVVVELAQRSYSNSRTVQFDDVVANAVGVVAGTCAVAAFALVWKAVSAMRSGLRR